MIGSVALDLYILRLLAGAVDSIYSWATNQSPYHVRLVDEFAAASYLELDYENEAANQRRFRADLSSRSLPVRVPAVHAPLSTRRVLVSEWIEGIPLTDADPSTLARLVPLGVELFLAQLLDSGSFHSDPHPGNLLVDGEGRLCLLDFGLCAEIEPEARRAMTAAIVHLLTGDFEALIAVDAVELGFLPPDFDTERVRPVLTKILSEGLLEGGSNLRERKRRLRDISAELNEVFFEYPFSVPPFFALITRGLGILEGIALTGDPEFDIFKASYPYAKRRAVQIFGVHGLNTLRRKYSSR
uniref:ABC1 atypical kinase-like domain-containing protein n=1 Tax=Corethron hystrix TaxID=216773 RepID=A0A7S1BSA8_9STRA